MSAAEAIVLLIAASRLAELGWSARNTRRLMADGGVEIGAGHYQYFVLLHIAWLAMVLFATPPERAPIWPLVAVLVLLQVARLWTIVSLGPYWTTKVIVVPRQPLIRKGPYRFMPHPAYLIAGLEIAMLPLTFGEVRIAIAFTLLNLALIAWRIQVEDEALAAARRAA